MKSNETEAGRVIRLFGGARQLASIMLTVGTPIDPVTIYRWDYPKDRGGSGGLVPRKWWDDLRAAARRVGIHLGHPFEPGEEGIFS